jgi:hypothetical protein
MQKIKGNTHRPPGNLIRPRVVDPVRARALRSPFPRDHFLYIYSVCVYLSFSLFFLFFLGEKFKSREEKKVELWTNGLKTKKFWLRLADWGSRAVVEGQSAQKKKN